MIAAIKQMRPQSVFADDSKESIVLDGQQQEVYEKLKAFADDSNPERLFTFTGYSGTGKSTVMSVFIKRHLAAHPMAKVIFAAQSNKAAKVLRQMISAQGLSHQIECVTVAKLLSIKPEINTKTGKQVFVEDRFARDKIEIADYDIVGVDECSMLGLESVSLLMSKLDGLFVMTKVIFFGDSAQLKPVNEGPSPTFTLAPENCRAHLTEVRRYSGAVAVAAERIRSDDGWALSPVVITGHSDDRTKGVFNLTPEQYERCIRKAFTTEAYHQDPDQAKVLCYTNAEVDATNQFIHRLRYGDSAPRFVEGACIIANSAIKMGSSTTAFTTSDELRIETAWQGRDAGWKVWRLEVIGLAEGKEHTISVLHKDEHERFGLELKQIAQAHQWAKFWRMREMFADVDHPYALTVHKSQGSTYQDVFVGLGGILKCKDLEDRKSLAYVAFTRAANRVFYI